jgi:broad specificity phosphatase PhoE
MTELILVRHGQTISNLKQFLQGQSDGELTDVGRDQARAIAATLKDMPIDVVIASPLVRAKDTAFEIASYHHLPVVVNALVREWHCGTLDGQPAQALFDARAQAGLPLADFRPEDGETLREVQSRAGKFLHLIEADYNGLRVVVCSHGDFLRMLFSLMLGISIEEANGIYLENATYSHFVNINGNWEMWGLNLVDIKSA